jgi:hypothetical protein
MGTRQEVATLALSKSSSSASEVAATLALSAARLISWSSVNWPVSLLVVRT